MTLPEIQRAVEALPEEEQAELAKWVAGRDAAIWDAEIERDFSAGGSGEALLETVRQQVLGGQSKPFRVPRSDLPLICCSGFLEALRKTTSACA